MVEIALLSLLLGIAALCFGVLRRRRVEATAFWIAAMAAKFGSGGSNFLLGEVPLALPVGYVLSTVYPVLLLAGAIAYGGWLVPWWLVPAGAALGGLRAVLVLESAPLLGQTIALFVEPAAAAAAAALVYHLTRGRPAALAERALAPALVLVAALELVTALGTSSGDTVSAPLAGAWMLVAPLVLALQIAAGGERIQRTLRRAGRELETRVAERTAALAASVERLEEQIAVREAAERALRESEERYRAVSELSSDYSFCVRMDADSLAMDVEWVTAAIEPVLGYTREEIDREGWIALIPPEDLDAVASTLRDVVAGASREMELRIVAKSGELRWLAVRLDTRRGEDGRPRIFGSARNVTERRRAERERLRLEQHMHEVQRLESLGVLAGGIAHDFNNVLTVIAANGRLALADLDAGESPRERLVRIEAAAAHAAALTDQMLTYSGRGAVKLEPLDVSQLARDMLDLLRASVSRKCRLDVELDGELPPVEGDATQIRQVILNLVNNAADALGERGGDVCVRTGRVDADASDLLDAWGTPDPQPGSYVFVEVRDTGRGMDEALQARVFEPFFTTKPSGSGGLGLAAVLGIVRAHRGVICVESDPGRGTRFRVLLPVA